MKYWVLLLGFIVSLIYADDPDYEIFAAILFIISCIYAFYLIIKLVVKLIKKLFNAGEQANEADPNFEEREDLKTKYSEHTSEAQSQGKADRDIDISLPKIQNWLQSAQVVGTIDGDGDLSVDFEPSEEVFTDKQIKIYLIGSQTLSSGGKSKTFDVETDFTTNEANSWRSNYLEGVDNNDPNFAMNMKLACHVCSDFQTIPITVKEGKINDFPLKVGNIQVSELSIILEDDEYRFEGSLTGENGFIYGIEASTEEFEPEQPPTAAKAEDDENTAEVYEFLPNVEKGDTIYIQIASFTKIDGEIAIDFTGKAEVQEPTIYDEDEDLNENFNRPEVEDVKTQEGDIGLFEFQIKRGLVDEENIDDEEISDLVIALKELCENEEFEKAASLLLPKLSFEFAPNDLDDEPEKYFLDLDYIDFECSDENTSVKVGVDGDGDLLITITVQFEIALNAGISTGELQEYLPDSGAWAVAVASPGWGYYESDGENVRFLGLKSDGSKTQPDGIPDSFEGTVHAITIKRAEQISDFGLLSANNHSMDGPELTIYLVNDLDTEDYHLVLRGEHYYLASVEEFDWEAPKYALLNIQQKLQQTLSLNDEQTQQLIFYIQANVTDEADDLDEAQFTHHVSECGEVNGEDHFKDEEDAANRIWISTGQNFSAIDVKIDTENFSIQFDNEFLEEKEVASWSKFTLASSPKSAARAWNPDNDSRSSTNPKGCTLYFKGAGYEFSASRLNKEDIREMKRLADEDIDSLLSGGRFAENACVGYDGEIVDLKYGIDPLDVSLRWVDFPEEDDPTIDDENCFQVEFVDDPTPEKEVVDYFNVAEGKVFGSISIPINHPSEFDPEKLRIEYFEFSLDGYPEQYGRIIEKIEYDGLEIEFEWEDNGLDFNTFLIGYELDNEGELEGHLVIHNSHGGENFDFNWKLANKIFSSGNVSKLKSIMDVSSQPIGSMEFKIEVASACAESGMNYKDFAKLYNLNADELNTWAVEFLGDGFE